MRQRSDRGETLVEIVITIFIVSIAVTALIASLGSAAGSAKSHKDNVLTDTVMRNYAEATKRAADACIVGANYTVVYTPPSGFSVSGSGTGTACPALTATKLLTLSVTGPASVTKTMQIKVRTP